MNSVAHNPASGTKKQPPAQSVTRLLSPVKSRQKQKNTTANPFFKANKSTYEIKKPFPNPFEAPTKPERSLSQPKKMAFQALKIPVKPRKISHQPKV